MYEHDKRIIMTLDAGGTNFVFSAIQSGIEIIDHIVKPAVSDNLERCLQTLLDGFIEVKSKLQEEPTAISFAFPGPADYKNGIIGDLPNFPCFRGGVALGNFLEQQMNIPVFINNDGNLFAYGEALAGALPQINHQLRKSGNPKQYENLLGITLGTGLGAGVVLNGILLRGDNNCGGDAWNLRNKLYPHLIAEESASIRAVKRVYAEESKTDASNLTPKDIFDIAEGNRTGNQIAAIESFRQLGEVAGDAICQMLNVIDGLVVIGGGLIGASKYILPALIKEMRSQLAMSNGNSFPRLQFDVYNLTDELSLRDFLSNNSQQIKVPQSNEIISYNPSRRIGIITSTIGTSKSVSLGAYTFALKQLDTEENKL